ncbi:HK97 gp10 family phage protein [Novosphingobium sp. FSY-8]|uniref:HK97 gp10 family phage protein n=1 Tax=Novosphingobium ovatum TaxID=1908523 RepID=A0ABW9XFN7_9SPHN|nr:HK97-gp10 family putative phage morphogenesis protein [Novosphingobium ovatum]NBC37360.1 HK97 gp10 family phage protein [Novosphingobium ovatum]
MGFKGKDRHLRRLRGLRTGAIDAAGKVVFVGSDMVRAEAFRSISAGAVSGKGHVPSKPGEPPNRDTGVLQAHITNTKTGALSAEVRSDAPYALGLETGTSKVAARPYMRPARDKMAPVIRKLFAQELGKILKGAK